MSIHNRTFNWYPKARKNLLGSVSITAGMTTLGLMLLDSSYTYSNTHEYVSDLTGEVTTNGGARIYAANVTVTVNDTETIVSCDDTLIWTAGPSDLTGRYFAFFVNETGADSVKPLLAWGLMDSGNIDVVSTAGKQLKYVVPAGGLFELNG